VWEILTLPRLVKCLQIHAYQHGVGDSALCQEFRRLSIYLSVFSQFTETGLKMSVISERMPEIVWTASVNLGHPAVGTCYNLLTLLGINSEAYSTQTFKIGGGGGG
jgi:hypothetical protein